MGVKIYEAWRFKGNMEALLKKLSKFHEEEIQKQKNRSLG